MLRQKRNLSAFRQYQDEVANISSEETYISDYSDDGNEENCIFNGLNGNSFGANCTDLNLSVPRTTQQISFYYTPPAKRIKRVPLSTVSYKSLEDGHAKKISLKGSTSLFQDFNSTIRKRRNSNITISNHSTKDDDELQELTIEWSSSDEADNTTARSLLSNGTQNSTQNSTAAILEGSQILTSSSAKKTNPFRRCRKSGYLHQLKETIEHLRTDRKFLEHDKKFGIRQCITLHVLKVEKSFGVHIGTVCSHNDEISLIVLDPDLAEHVKIGSILEAFTEQVDFYEIEHCDKIRKVYIHPSKFMLQ